MVSSWNGRPEPRANPPFSTLMELDCGRQRVGTRSVPASEIRVAGRARERDHIANVFEAGQVHHHAFESETETRVRHGTVAAQVEIPPVGLFIQTRFAQPL